MNMPILIHSLNVCDMALMSIKEYERIQSIASLTAVRHQDFPATFPIIYHLELRRGSE
jgi:hypothetical protein